MQARLLSYHTSPTHARRTPAAPKRTSPLGARCASLLGHVGPTRSPGRGYSSGASQERGPHQLPLTAPLHTWLGWKGGGGVVRFRTQVGGPSPVHHRPHRSQLRALDHLTGFLLSIKTPVSRCTQSCCTQSPALLSINPAHAPAYALPPTPTHNLVLFLALQDIWVVTPKFCNKPTS